MLNVSLSLLFIFRSHDSTVIRWLERYQKHLMIKKNNSSDNNIFSVARHPSSKWRIAKKAPYTKRPRAPSASTQTSLCSTDTRGIEGGRSPPPPPSAIVYRYMGDLWQSQKTATLCNKFVDTTRILKSCIYISWCIQTLCYGTKDFRSLINGVLKKSNS